MPIGDTITVSDNQITEYNQSCTQTNQRAFPIEMTLESHIIDFDAGGDLGKQNVIVLKYDSSVGLLTGVYEKFYYSLEWGWIKWEEYSKATNTRTNQSIFNKITTPIAPDKTVSCTIPVTSAAPSPSPTSTPRPSTSPTPTPSPTPRASATPTPKPSVTPLSATTPVSKNENVNNQISNNSTPQSAFSVISNRQNTNKLNYASPTPSASPNTINEESENCGPICTIGKLLGGINKAIEKGIEGILVKLKLLPPQENRF